jgi:hypothetical protein
MHERLFKDCSTNLVSELEELQKRQSEDDCVKDKGGNPVVQIVIRRHVMVC